MNGILCSQRYSAKLGKQTQKWPSCSEKGSMTEILKKSSVIQARELCWKTKRGESGKGL